MISQTEKEQLEQRQLARFAFAMLILIIVSYLGFYKLRISLTPGRRAASV